jgi:hypothetical protein
VRTATVLVRLTVAQAEALCFACTNTLVEPANFERGTGRERTIGPLERAHAALVKAIAKAEGR